MKKVKEEHCKFPLEEKKLCNERCQYFYTCTRNPKNRSEKKVGGIMAELRLPKETVELAFEQAMQSIETITGKSLKECVDLQTPMKPIRVTAGEVVSTYRCPSCIEHIVWEIGHHPYEEYCSNCGQKIDWSKE